METEDSEINHPGCSETLNMQSFAIFTTLWRWITHNILSGKFKKKGLSTALSFPFLIRLQEMLCDLIKLKKM